MLVNLNIVYCIHLFIYFVLYEMFNEKATSVFRCIFKFRINGKKKYNTAILM